METVVNNQKYEISRQTNGSAKAKDKQKEMQKSTSIYKLLWAHGGYLGTQTNRSAKALQFTIATDEVRRK